MTINQRSINLIKIPCPVCGTPGFFVEGEIQISGQVSFICNSRKCQGNMRFVNRDLLNKILDNFVLVSEHI